MESSVEVETFFSRTAGALKQPMALDIDSDGFVIVADYSTNSVQKINPKTLDSTYIWGPDSSSVSYTRGTIRGPSGIVCSKLNSALFYLVDTVHAQVKAFERENDNSYKITITAGSGYRGNAWAAHTRGTEDVGKQAKQIALNDPMYATLNKAETKLLIFDTNNFRVVVLNLETGFCEVNVAFNISMTQEPLFGTFDPLDEIDIWCSIPSGLCIFPQTSGLFSDIGGKIVCGHESAKGYADGPSASARFYGISSFLLKRSEDYSVVMVLMSDRQNHAIRFFNSSSQLVSTITGSPMDLTFYLPSHMCWFGEDDVLVTNFGKHEISIIHGVSFLDELASIETDAHRISQSISSHRVMASNIV